MKITNKIVVNTLHNTSGNNRTISKSLKQDMEKEKKSGGMMSVIAALGANILVAISSLLVLLCLAQLQC